jgi:hypothetical protein
MKGKLMQFMRKHKWECAFGGIGSVVLIAVLILCAVKFGNLAAGGGSGCSFGRRGAGDRYFR